VRPEDFIARELGMVREVLAQYGPVNRFWFDGTTAAPAGTNMTDLWIRVFEEIRTTSPQVRDSWVEPTGVQQLG
jgi:hypothetical protein